MITLNKPEIRGNQIKMMDLSLFFKNPFNPEDVSDEDLRKFTEYHLKILREHNDNGQFSTMIAETMNTYNTFFGFNRDNDSAASMQKALIQRQKDIISEFTALVKRKERSVRFIANEISPVIYYEFFPSGIKEFDTVTESNAETLMNRMLDSVNMHINDIGYEFLERLKELKTFFISLRDLISRGANGNGTASANYYRRTLEIQLLKNLLTFAIVYINDPEEGMSFFQDKGQNISVDAETVHNSFMLRKKETIRAS